MSQKVTSEAPIGASGEEFSSLSRKMFHEYVLVA